MLWLFTHHSGTSGTAGSPNKRAWLCYVCSDCSHTILGPMGRLGHQTKEHDCVMYALTVHTPFWDLWDGWVTKQKTMIVLCMLWLFTHHSGTYGTAGSPNKRPWLCYVCSDCSHTILGPMGRLGHQTKEHDCVMYALTVHTPFWDLWDGWVTKQKSMIVLCSDCSNTILGPMGQLSHQTKEDDCVMLWLFTHHSGTSGKAGSPNKRGWLCYVCSDCLHTILGPMGQLSHQTKEDDCVMLWLFTHHSGTSGTAGSHNRRGWLCYALTVFTHHSGTSGKAGSPNKRGWLCYVCSDCLHTILGPMGRLGHTTEEVLCSDSVYTPFWDLWDGWVTKQEDVLCMLWQCLHTILGPLGQLGHTTEEDDSVMYALTVFTHHSGTYGTAESPNKRMCYALIVFTHHSGTYGMAESPNKRMCYALIVFTHHSGTYGTAGSPNRRGGVMLWQCLHTILEPIVSNSSPTQLMVG